MAQSQECVVTVLTAKTLGSVDKLKIHYEVKIVRRHNLRQMFSSVTARVFDFDLISSRHLMTSVRIILSLSDCNLNHVFYAAINKMLTSQLFY